jgi:hypothetical protein
MAGASNKAPAAMSARLARDDDLRVAAIDCVMCCPMDAHRVMLCTTNAAGAPRFRLTETDHWPVKHADAHDAAMELLRAPTVCIESQHWGSRTGSRLQLHICVGPARGED